MAKAKKTKTLKSLSSNQAWEFGLWAVLCGKKNAEQMAQEIGLKFDKEACLQAIEAHMGTEMAEKQRFLWGDDKKDAINDRRILHTIYCEIAKTRVKNRYGLENEILKMKRENADPGLVKAKMLELRENLQTEITRHEEGIQEFRKWLADLDVAIQENSSVMRSSKKKTRKEKD